MMSQTTGSLQAAPGKDVERLRANYRAVLAQEGMA